MFKLFTAIEIAIEIACGFEAIDNLRKNIDVVGQKLYDNAKKMSDVVKKDMRKILNEI